MADADPGRHGPAVPGPAAGSGPAVDEGAPEVFRRIGPALRRRRQRRGDRRGAGSGCRQRQGAVGPSERRGVLLDRGPEGRLRRLEREAEGCHLPRQAGHAGRAGGAHRGAGARDRAAGRRRPGSGRTGRAPVQGRPGLGHGGRVPGTAGHHGRLLRPSGRSARRRGRRHPRPLQTARTGRHRPDRPGHGRRRHGRKAGHPGRLLRHRRKAHRLEGSLCASPRRAGLSIVERAEELLLTTLVNSRSVAAEKADGEFTIDVANPEAARVALLSEWKLHLGVARITPDYVFTEVAQKAVDVDGDWFALRALDLLQADVGSFFADRLTVLLRDKGQRHDLVAAVFALGDDDLVARQGRMRGVGARFNQKPPVGVLAPPSVRLRRPPSPTRGEGSGYRIAGGDPVRLEVVLRQPIQRSENAGEEILRVAVLDRRAQPVGDDGARRIGPDRAGDAQRDLYPLGDPARHSDEEVHARQKIRAAQHIQGDHPILDPVGPHDDAAAVRPPVIRQFDRPPQTEPHATRLRPDGVHRTPGPVDAIAAQLARRLGQFGQVQRDHAAALDAAAAGPVGKKGKAHARPLAENPAKSARVDGGGRRPGKEEGADAAHDLAPGRGGHGRCGAPVHDGLRGRRRADAGGVDRRADLSGRGADAGAAGLSAVAEHDRLPRHRGRPHPDRSGVEPAGRRPDVLGLPVWAYGRWGSAGGCGVPAEEFYRRSGGGRGRQGAAGRRPAGQPLSGRGLVQGHARAGRAHHGPAFAEHDLGAGRGLRPYPSRRRPVLLQHPCLRRDQTGADGRVGSHADLPANARSDRRARRQMASGGRGGHSPSGAGQRPRHLCRSAPARPEDLQHPERAGRRGGQPRGDSGVEHPGARRDLVRRHGHGGRVSYPEPAPDGRTTGLDAGSVRSAHRLRQRRSDAAGHAGGGPGAGRRAGLRHRRRVGPGSPSHLRPGDRAPDRRRPYGCALGRLPAHLEAVAGRRAGPAQRGCGDAGRAPVPRQCLGTALRPAGDGGQDGPARPSDGRRQPGPADRVRRRDRGGGRADGLAGHVRSSGGDGRAPAVAGAHYRRRGAHAARPDGADRAPVGRHGSDQLGHDGDVAYRRLRRPQRYGTVRRPFGPTRAGRRSDGG
uniref:Type VI secretion system tip protein VgrG n=1 Tax=Parastrongyloides trichosuri TaxID=131310 RepID=A0A0N4Z3T1_PARTI